MVLSSSSFAIITMKKATKCEENFGQGEEGLRTRETYDSNDLLKWPHFEFSMFILVFWRST
jgi:hypothetical protein